MKHQEYLSSINFFHRPSYIQWRNYGNYVLSVALAMITIAGCSERADTITVVNPSGLVKASVYADSAGRLVYSIQYRNKIIVGPSPLGITIDQQDLGEGVKIGLPVFSTVDEKYRSKGVHEEGHNHYREATIPITSRRRGTTYQLEIKAFDDGIAFRYVVPKKGISIVQGEASSWKVPKGSTVWCQEDIYDYEGLYQTIALSRLGSRKIGPPLTYQTPDGIYVSVTEAALYNYSGMALQSDSSGMLRALFDNDAQGWKIQDTIVTPWRVAIVSPDLNGLVNADIIQNLNPSADSGLLNADWIRPGKALWSYFVHGNVTTMALEKKYIDKASTLGFEYNMVDAGWETSWPHAMDSLKALVAYAQRKKVGIWVWKSYSSIKEDTVRRSFFKNMHNIGVAGIKIDFIDKEGIEEVRFYQAALKDATVYHLMLDFHGADKPTGYNRTYPNELTREAIYGQEWTTYNPQGPSHNAITPFTRFLAGPADATPGVFDSKKAYGTSRAHQLALQIIFNSALSCWPSDPDAYLNSAALPLIRAVPTVWDETIVLPCSSIGKVAAFARRKGADWFVGAINAGDEKRFMIPLKFLRKGNFETRIFQDDLTNSDDLLYSNTLYSSSDSLLVVMRPSGGYAAMLRSAGKDSTALTISPQGGYLYAPVWVTMKTNPGIEIRYTTNGQAPTAQSALYSRPFTIVKPALIKANAFSEGKAVEAHAVAQFLYAPAPDLSSPPGIFINTKTVGISTGAKKENIHYTLDGSEPSISSPLYSDSLVFTKSATLKAKTFFKSGMGSSSITAVYDKQNPLAAVTASKITNGLRAVLFEGEWTRMPDFKNLAGGKTTVVSQPNLELLQSPQEYYAIQFSGYIKIPDTNVYSFYIISDDGSQLFIDGRKVVDNDGCHGDLEKSGESALAAGLHWFTLNYFQNGSGQTLKVYMKAPGIERQIIAPSLFFH